MKACSKGWNKLINLFNSRIQKLTCSKRRGSCIRLPGQRSEVGETTRRVDRSRARARVRTRTAVDCWAGEFPSPHPAICTSRLHIAATAKFYLHRRAVRIYIYIHRILLRIELCVLMISISFGAPIKLMSDLKVSRTASDIGCPHQPPSPFSA
jgi:hypothetical protein